MSWCTSAAMYGTSCTEDSHSCPIISVNTSAALATAIFNLNAWSVKGFMQLSTLTLMLTADITLRDLEVYYNGSDAGPDPMFGMPAIRCTQCTIIVAGNAAACSKSRLAATAAAANSTFTAATVDKTKFCIVDAQKTFHSSSIFHFWPVKPSMSTTPGVNGLLILKYLAVFNALVNVDNTTKAAFNGGVVQMTGGALYVTSSFFANNTAVGVTHIDGGTQRSSGAVIWGSDMDSFRSTTTNTPSYFTLVVQNSTFYKNSATGSGGVLYVKSINPLTSSANTIQIAASNFLNSTAGVQGAGHGGAIYVGEPRLTLNIMGSSFDGNMASSGSGGAIYSRSQHSVFQPSATGSPKLLTMFTNNAARDQKGGAVFLSLDATSFISKQVILRNNVASTGGALAIADDSNAGTLQNDWANISVSFVSTTASQNTAKDTSGAGGGQGGAVALIGWPTSQGGSTIQRMFLLSLFNSNFTSNICNEAGGGLYATPVFFINANSTTFTSNIATGPTARGGALASDLGFQVNLTSCGFTNNSVVGAQTSVIAPNKPVSIFFWSKHWWRPVSSHECYQGAHWSVPQCWASSTLLQQHHFCSQHSDWSRRGCRVSYRLPAAGG